MKQESTTLIELNRDEIKNVMEKNGEYRTNDVLIKKWDSESGESEQFLAEINKGYSKFCGVLNNSFDRDGYGYYSF